MRALLPFAISMTMVLGVATHGWAQERASPGAGHPETQQLKAQDTVPPATDHNKPEQGGKQEPSSKIPNASENAGVFSNGVLNVPGAATETQTTPAKHSSQNAEDDRLPIIAYRLKALSKDARADIARQLIGQQAPGEAQAMDVAIGTELPAPVLQPPPAPVPEALAAKFPELRGAGFMRTGTKVVLVDLDDNVVIGVLDS